MISKPPNQSTGPSVSSQLGRKWLVATDDVLPQDGSSANLPSVGDPSPKVGLDKQQSNIPQNSEHVASTHTDDKFPSIDVAGEALDRGTVFISVPDVASSIGDAFTALDYSLMNDPQELATALAKASEERLDAVRGVEDPEGGEPSLAETMRVMLAPESTENDSAKSAKNDLAEPPTEWTDKPSTKETPRKESGKPTKQTGKNQAIEKLANAIVERFPLGDPTVLMFVGSESNHHIDETCARVASTLAERKIGRILLVDSDTDCHELSNASGVSGQPGITDVANEAIDWESTIYGGSATGLDFLGAGTGVFYHPDSSSRLRKAVADLKREYQFICISAGDARSPSARIWHDICDGSYLLVSMKNSNQTIARSAVAEMQISGARLLGCVVTDVD